MFSQLKKKVKFMEIVIKNIRKIDKNYNLINLKNNFINIMVKKVNEMDMLEEVVDVFIIIKMVKEVNNII